MLDVSGSMEGNLPLLRAAAAELFGRLRPDDLARVGTFGREVDISDTFTRDAGALGGALPDGIEPDAPTPLWRALDQAMDAFGDEGDERRVVLVLSDGKDSGPIDFRQPVASQAEVIDRARREDVMIYAIGMRSRRRQPRMPGIGTGGLRAALLDDLPTRASPVSRRNPAAATPRSAGRGPGGGIRRRGRRAPRPVPLGFAPPKRDGKKHELRSA